MKDEKNEKKRKENESFVDFIAEFCGIGLAIGSAVSDWLPSLVHPSVLISWVELVVGIQVVVTLVFLLPPF